MGTAERRRKKAPKGPNLETAPKRTMKTKVEAREKNCGDGVGARGRQEEGGDRGKKETGVWKRSVAEAIDHQETKKLALMDQNVLDPDPIVSVVEP